jgi:hypothetical protein
MFQKTPVSQRQYCKKCGGPLDDKSPATWIGGCLCGYGADAEI